LRNGLMIALLAHRPIRLKNYAALEIGHTFKEAHCIRGRAAELAAIAEDRAIFDRDVDGSIFE
jgi:hypothetical protein